MRTAHLRRLLADRVEAREHRHRQERCHADDLDAFIDTLSVDSLHGQHYLIRVRLSNAGVVDLPTTTVRLQLGSQGRAPTTTLLMPGPIAAGAYREDTYDWVGRSVPPGWITILATADPANLNDEFDDSNNTRSTVILP